MLRLRRAHVGLLAATVGLLLAACDPIPHPNATFVEPPLGTVDFQHLSADGQFVVVNATGPSATVPAAGTWRIDRGDGTATSLPATAQRISGDGQRIILSGGALWNQGTTTASPSGAVYSDDLTALAYLGTAGTIQVQDVATGTVRPVEADFPRPPGTVSVTPRGVSDDGSTVMYRLVIVAQPAIVRTVDLDTGTHVDVTDESESSISGAVVDDLTLSPNGRSVAHLHQVVEYDFDFAGTVVSSSLRLIEIATGDTLAEYVNPTDEAITHVLVGAGGDVAWAYQERSVPDGVFGCPTSPVPWSCVVSSRAVMIGTNGRSRTFDTGPNAIASVDTTTNGRFLVLTKDLVDLEGLEPVGPVRVYDWAASGNGSELLLSAPTYTETSTLYCRALSGGVLTAPCDVPALSAHGEMADDGRLVVTSGIRGGWYEYTADD